VLELWEADGAFEALEAYLAAELREGLVADVYLGYGLSQALRRERRPPPPSTRCAPRSRGATSTR